MFSYCFVYHVNNPLLYAIQEIIKTVVNGNLFLKVIEKLKYIELLRKSFKITYIIVKDQKIYKVSKTHGKIINKVNPKTQSFPRPLAYLNTIKYP